ncbi:MAG: hypothetical protein BGN96_16535 [Bacteroidales bacterium 45-6]|nr:MAG: hypothetical protein BGN96_16535 [Bacteroidales bacterium 45-6]
MNAVSRVILKGMRKLYLAFNPDAVGGGRNWKMFSQKEYANNLICELLQKDEPCMIARFGSTEMLCLINYLGIKQNNRNWGEYIKGKTPEWWWETNVIDQLQKWSGFFPGGIDKVEQFCELIIKDIPQVDLLGSWLLHEKYFKNELTGCKKVVLEDLEPFFATNPWTRALAGKKVLVVHPFAETIRMQYKKRELLFDNDLLPAFDLKIIQAVQSIAGEKTAHADWFAALKWMEDEIDKVDYDIAIVDIERIAAVALQAVIEILDAAVDGALVQIEGAAGDEVDLSAERVGVAVGRERLDHLDAGNHVRRDRAEVHGARLRAGGGEDTVVGRRADVGAVEGDGIELGLGAANGGEGGTTIEHDTDARQAREGIADGFVGQVADGVRGDDARDGVRSALLVDGARLAFADTLDLEGFEGDDFGIEFEEDVGGAVVADGDGPVGGSIAEVIDRDALGAVRHAIETETPVAIGGGGQVGAVDRDGGAPDEVAAVVGDNTGDRAGRIDGLREGEGEAEQEERGGTPTRASRMVLEGGVHRDAGVRVSAASHEVLPACDQR